MMGSFLRCSIPVTERDMTRIYIVAIKDKRWSLFMHEFTLSTLLQDAANTTLRSEILQETVCNAIIANSAVCKPSEMCKMFAMMNASNTVQVLVVCAMKGIRFSSMNCLR